MAKINQTERKKVMKVKIGNYDEKEEDRIVIGDIDGDDNSKSIEPSPNYVKIIFNDKYKF